MKLHFEDNLDYQKKAIESVVGLFKGQEISRSEFTLMWSAQSGTQTSMGTVENFSGVGNNLQLSDEAILDNLRLAQFKNELPQTEALTSGDFTVEMETGTGKTYVYLRTIFELNENYGFTKFVIVVPSIAIKEGTNKTLEITRDHFEALYPKAKGYEFFQYNSQKLGQVRNFATSSNIQIMLATVGAINKKDVNNLYKENENIGGDRPIDLIKATNPIIIVDEPQSVDGGLQGRGREALNLMKPLCTLRYSATHKDTYNMVYRLDAIDAYNLGLVKEIEVASLEIEGGYNTPYVKLIKTKNVRGSIVATIEGHAQHGDSAVPQEFQVEDGDDLQYFTERPLYENMLIGTVTCGKDNETIEIITPQGEEVLRPGQVLGGVDEDTIKRKQISTTIKQHLDKELKFKKLEKHVKVLSLFFIDRVENYRSYSKEGKIISGKYAKMFEEEYMNLAKQKEYKELFENFNPNTDIKELHNGYFSIDKNGQWTDTSENDIAGRKEAERAYSLIMQKKEELLSFDTKLKFIFSHSALKEGWDNPNVFQICTLREIGGELERRQTIGRGLRLCVDQNGLRDRDSNINTLTVIATENYEDFARKLQKDIERDTGIEFGVVEKYQFALIPIKDENDNYVNLGKENSEKIWKYLKEKDYLDLCGKITDDLRILLHNGEFTLPEEFKKYQEPIEKMLKKIAGKINIKNANKKKNIKINHDKLDSPEFKALWDRIKHKTTYRVKFDNDKLLRDAIKAIDSAPTITATKIIIRNAEIAIGESGVTATETSISAPITIKESDIKLPDIITEIQDKTQLTRKSIVKILLGITRLLDFKRNPQQFIEICIQAINRTKQLALVDGIKYQKIGDDDYYTQELFKKEELNAYAQNTIKVEKSIHEDVVYSPTGVEKKFAEDLEKNGRIKVYVKLPTWFKVPTPLGSYNPDWAIVVEDNGQEKLFFFVVETKSSLWWNDYRYREGAKIKCAEEHFEEIKTTDKPAKYIKATDVKDVMNYIAD